MSNTAFQVFLIKTDFQYSKNLNAYNIYIYIYACYIMFIKKLKKWTFSLTFKNSHYVKKAKEKNYEHGVK